MKPKRGVRSLARPIVEGRSLPGGLGGWTSVGWWLVRWPDAGAARVRVSQWETKSAIT